MIVLIRIAVWFNGHDEPTALDLPAQIADVALTVSLAARTILLRNAPTQSVPGLSTREHTLTNAITKGVGVAIALYFATALLGIIILAIAFS